MLRQKAVKTPTRPNMTRAEFNSYLNEERRNYNWKAFFKAAAREQ